MKQPEVLSGVPCYLLPIPCYLFGYQAPVLLTYNRNRITSFEILRFSYTLR